MRLIDADELKKKIRHWNYNATTSTPTFDFVTDEDIDDMPTVKSCKDAISRNNAITSICQWGTALERSGRYTITISEMKQECADMLCELPMAILEPTVCDIDAIRAEIEVEKDGYPPSADEYKTINKVLQIIERHMKGDTNV